MELAAQIKIDYRTLRSGEAYKFSKEEQIASFWKKVEKRGGDECWSWNASTRNGYGSHQWNGKHAGAHRVAYELAFGKIPRGKFVLHKCNNRICTNPKHLKLGTHFDNMQDIRAVGKGFHEIAHGEDHSRARLSAAQVKRIRESSDDALSVAKMYGVTRRHIYHIRAMRAWKRNNGKGLGKWKSHR